MTISERAKSHQVLVGLASVAKNGIGQARSSESGLSGNDSDPLRQYLFDIRGISLLTPKQERELGTSVQAGLETQKLLEELEEYDPLPELLQTIQRGKEARQRLIEGNLRLVVSVAKRYQRRGLGILDLIQEGNLGLFRAVDSYDPQRGYRFSTYATWWIRQRIIRAIQDQGRTIRLPVHIQDQINKITSARRTLPVSLGREPTDQEVADHLGIGVDRLREILSHARHPVSLDTPLNPDDDKDDTLADFIRDKSPSPEEIGEERVLNADVQDALERLSPRERRVIKLRFGIFDGVPWTLEEIGEEFGVSRERIRQMQAQALRKLGIQNPELRRYLK